MSSESSRSSRFSVDSRETLQGGVPKRAHHIGQRLREARNARGLSQRDFATRVGKHYNTVAAWEAGSSLPDLDVAQDVSRELGVSFTWLATGDGEPKSRGDSIQLLQDFELYGDAVRLFVLEENRRGLKLDAEKGRRLLTAICKMTQALGRVPDPDLVSEMFPVFEK